MSYLTKLRDLIQQSSFLIEYTYYRKKAKMKMSNKNKIGRICHRYVKIPETISFINK